MDAAKYAELFQSESREHLSQVNAALLALEGAPTATEPVAQLFRAVHTMKGMAATMGFSVVTEVAHELETLLDALRSGEQMASPAIIELLFAGADGLEESVARAVAGDEAPDAMAPLLAQLRAAVQPLSKSPAVTAGAPSGAPSGAAGAPSSSFASAAAPGRTVRIRLEPDTPLKGVRAFMIVQRARALGAVAAIWPPLESLQADQFDREFSLKLVSSQDAAAIADDLRKAGHIESVAVDVAAAPPAVPGASASTAAAASPAMATVTMRSIRVDTRRLDAMLDMVGELVIARDRLLRLAAGRDDATLSEAISQAGRLIGTLHDEILASRLVPVWQVFDRFPRLVRDAARDVGKRVELIVEGKEIELDRSLLEEIADPLVHLLKNAVDHGLESPEVRAAAGKPAQGRVTLSAVRDRSAVLVRVHDDGRGIDRAKVLAKAKREGILEPSRTELTDDDLLKVIARPGFSTATQVTGLSGRGVGIDAVIAKVRSIGGTVEVKSVEGEGTTVTLRLPVTLAIVSAVMSRIGDEVYALPMTHVHETIELSAAQPQTLRGREVMVLRNEVLPLVHLRDLVRLPRRASGEGQVVVVERAERRAGVVVDRLLGQQEIVVKPFDPVRGAAALFSGATILSDGAPALILDVNTLL